MNGPTERIAINGLDQVFVEAGLLRQALVLQVSVARDRDEDHPSSRVRGAESTRQLPAVDTREPDVDDRNVRLEFKGPCETSEPVFCLVHLVPVQLEHEANHLTRVGAVLDKQDTARALGRDSSRSSRERLNGNGDTR